MTETTPTNEEITEENKKLEAEVSVLKEDLDALGDKLENEEITIEDFQKESNATLAKHTFKDFMNFFNSSYEKIKLTMENPDAYISKQKVFIGDGKLTGQARKRRAKTEEIKIRAALRQTANILDSYELHKLTDAYVSEKCVLLRNKPEAIEAAKKWFNNNLGSSLTKVNNADALNNVKNANIDLLDTLGTHLLLAARALGKKEGFFDTAPMCLQLTKNANAVMASIMASKSIDEEELKKFDFTALEVFSNALKDFNSVVEHCIREAG